MCPGLVPKPGPLESPDLEINNMTHGPLLLSREKLSVKVRTACLV